MSYYFKKPEKEIIIYDDLEKIDKTNIYSIPVKLYRMIRKIDIDFNFFHYNSLLIKKVLNLGSNEKFSKQLFVHLHFDTMDIFL